jgi:putative flippase GtrA
VNAFAGKAVLVACGLSAFLILFYQGTWLRSGWSQLFAFLVPLAAAIVAAFVYERRTAR